jgi:hypothetical protein
LASIQHRTRIDADKEDRERLWRLKLQTSRRMPERVRKAPRLAFCSTWPAMATVLPNRTGRGSPVRTMPPEGHASAEMLGGPLAKTQKTGVLNVWWHGLRNHPEWHAHDAIQLLRPKRVPGRHGPRRGARPGHQWELLYGTTVYGGANNDGTVFSLSVGLGPFVETQPTSGKVCTTQHVGSPGLTFRIVARCWSMVMFPYSVVMLKNFIGGEVICLQLHGSRSSPPSSHMPSNLQTVRELVC